MTFCSSDEEGMIVFKMYKSDFKHENFDLIEDHKGILTR
jgi:hypothetical protein